jgi:hypothetical protein
VTQLLTLALLLLLLLRLLLLLLLLHLLLLPAAPLLCPQANEQEEDDFLVYNWVPQFTGRRAASGGMEEDFMQTYVFGPAPVEAARLQQRRQQRRARVQQ